MGGFDAGIACALDLIPRHRQRLAARLHASYDAEVVQHVREEVADGLEPDSEATWWLAACSCCEEDPVGFDQILGQIDRFQQLVEDPVSRLAAARDVLADMTTSYEVRDGVGWALRDGGMQGAYLDGHDLAVMRSDAYDLWFVGTFHPTLGVEMLSWEEPGDPTAAERAARLGRSGPVGGSAQFVRCASEDELARVLTLAVAAIRRRAG